MFEGNIVVEQTTQSPELAGSRDVEEGTKHRKQMNKPVLNRKYPPPSARPTASFSFFFVKLNNSSVLPRF